MVIPKPACRCKVCGEARNKGGPYARTGPAAFIHDIHLLIDMPAEIASQLNREQIDRIDYVMFTHLDPDHVEGIRVLEQIALDFRTWQAYPEKQITLITPGPMVMELKKLRTVYGPIIDFYLNQGFIRLVEFEREITIDNFTVNAVQINRKDEIAFVYVFKADQKKMIYAPCDIKPFPEDSKELKGADILLIQPGIFQGGLKHGFVYPEGHISRETIYTYEDTLALAERIAAENIVFIHLEEYWNRSYDDYLKLESASGRVKFAYDGMKITI
jgi:phosphoribosyl 1,2-cyclic phosphate phosphodiesterase